MAIKRLIRGKGIHPSGPYKDLYSNRTLISFEGDTLKIDMKPLEVAFSKLMRVISLHNNKTFVVAIVLVAVAALLGIQKVNSRRQRSRAEYRAYQAIGLVK